MPSKKTKTAQSGALKTQDSFGFSLRTNVGSPKTLRTCSGVLPCNIPKVCGFDKCADGYDLKDGKCEAGDICASYSCGENQKAVTNYNSNGKVIGCTCCGSDITYFVRSIDECNLESYSYMGAINGNCCGGMVQMENGEADGGCDLSGQEPE